MIKIKIFDYDAENITGHLEEAKNELMSLGVRNIFYEKNGKPVAENCFVSISHSNGKCAVCKSDKPIGIDIEKIADRDFEKIIRRVFGEKEKEYFYRESSAKSFYEIWTRKEAYAKISGDGIKEVIRGTDTFLLDGYTFKTEITEDFVLTVCEIV